MNDKTGNAALAHQPPHVTHVDEHQWETIRWPGQTGKMMFHPRPENPNEPNAGIVRYEPGASHPFHKHDFAQVWYIIEGEFTIGGRLHGPGSMFFYADPHYEEELSTSTGGQMVFVQYPGPSTGGKPVYDGRFNMSERKSVAEERIDR